MPACNANTGLLSAPTIENAEVEIVTNYLGTLRMCRAFAPVLAAHGGGAIVNMISISGLVHLPLMGSLSASKAALRSLTQGVRAELRKQGTLVVGVLPGAVETRMTEGVPIPKIKPAEVAGRRSRCCREACRGYLSQSDGPRVARAISCRPGGARKGIVGLSADVTCTEWRTRPRAS